MKKKNILIAVLLIAIVFVVVLLFKKRKECFESGEGETYICVSTLRKYKDACDHLLESFPSGFTKYILSYQGEDVDTDYYEQKDDGHYEVYCKRNIFEYGAWPALNILKRGGILKDEDRILMIHDTCKLGEKTLEKVNALDFEDIFWASDNGRCNICVVKGKVLEEGGKMYQDMNELDKLEAIRMEWNHSHEKSPKRIQAKHIFYEKAPEYKGSRKVYSDLDREVLYFESLDIEKYYVYADASKPHPEKL